MQTGGTLKKNISIKNNTTKNKIKISPEFSDFLFMAEKLGRGENIILLKKFQANLWFCNSNPFFFVTSIFSHLSINFKCPLQIK